MSMTLSRRDERVLRHGRWDRKRLRCLITEKTPTRAGVDVKGYGLCYYLFKMNLPRSALRNRESFPLAEISRITEEYKVAAGVLPLGDFQ